MRKKILAIFSLLCVMALCLGLSSCDWFGSDDIDPEIKEKSYLINGGFESADLSGWTIEYGDAFDDDCVSSQKTFMYDFDTNYNVLSINHTGNWYLTGKGYHGKYSGARTGAIRSTNFLVPDDGVISLKLAGGALTVGKGTGAPQKARERICFVGFYLAENDKMIAMQTNEYFHEHTEEYVMPDRYASGVYNTDNFYEYYVDLSEYKNQEIYIRIVDNDESYYYGYIAVDDIRVGEYADS
ncbi:MAG: hypothetical protein IKW53_05780, partial [Clostridia bacterium]|nr:hypothetical protein [Clostridia bacterium]